MTIAFVVLTLSDHSGARAPLKIAESLTKLGHKISIYSSPLKFDSALKKRLEEIGIKVEIVSPFGLFKKLQVEKPELISFHATLPYQLFCKLVRIPVVKTYYGSQLPSMNLKEEKSLGMEVSSFNSFLMSLADKAVLFLEWLSFLLAEKTVGISKSTTEEARRFFKKEIGFVHLGSDFVKKRDQGEKEENLIISVSRIVPYKGFHILIKAFNHLGVKDLKLVIIGSSPKKDYFDYLKKLAGVRVEFVLNVTDEKLSEYYRSCLFYASATKWEGFGMPFLEAGLYGKPSLGMHNTSIPEIVKNGETGFLAESEDDFENCLRKLVEDSKLRSKMGENALKLAQTFIWEKTAREYEKIFKEIKK